jgi:SPP1 gp7 family putative phage head morphogenesis protein
MLAPIRPSAPLRNRYEARIHALIEEMGKSLIYNIKAQWRKDTPETVIMGADKSAAELLREMLERLGTHWQARFDDLAERMAEYFSSAVNRRCDMTLASQLRKAGMSVRFKMTPAMRDAYAAVRAENIGLIRSIAQQHLSKVETLVMQSVSQGRDLGTLTRELQRQTGVSKRRASFIARDQNNRATATMRAVREAEVGITEGIWMHSGGGKEPRPEHKSFSGKRFKLSEGHDFGDGFGKVLPGQAINCRCTWRPVIPGFE